VTLSVGELPCHQADLLENWECVDNAWSKMTKYCELTDKSYQIYAAAQRRDFFDNARVDKLQPLVEVMLANCRDI
jgi:hypothetical protein